MNARPQTLQAFLDGMDLAIHASSASERVRDCVSRVLAALKEPAPIVLTETVRLPESELLHPGLEPALRAGGELARLASAIAKLDPLLSWKRRPGAPAEPRHTYANAMVVGPGGIESRKDVWVGMTVMAPGIQYPLHQHAPEEVYLALTEGTFRQGEGEWFSPGVGGTLYNAPNIVHSMKASQNAPFVAIWCLRDDRHQPG